MFQGMTGRHGGLERMPGQVGLYFSSNSGSGLGGESRCFVGKTGGSLFVFSPMKSILPSLVPSLFQLFLYLIFITSDCNRGFYIVAC